MLVAIKTVHTAAFFSIGSCLAYFAYSSLAKRSDRRAAIAGAVVTGETIVYALNGFRCPLTSLAERLGSEHGSVADIYLPPWIEDHLPFVTGPIFAGAVVLHARNILRSREHSTALLKIPAADAPRPYSQRTVVDRASGDEVRRIRSRTRLDIGPSRIRDLDEQVTSITLMTPPAHQVMDMAAPEGAATAVERSP
jgi:hypothetical protein